MSTVGRVRSGLGVVPDEPVPPGERVRRARRRRGMSIEVTAGLIGKSKGWLSMIENGHLELDKLSDIIALARVLRVPVEDVAGVPLCQRCLQAAGERGRR